MTRHVPDNIIKKARLLYSKIKKVDEDLLRYDGAQDYDDLGIGLYFTTLDPNHEKFKSSGAVFWHGGNDITLEPKGMKHVKAAQFGRRVPPQKSLMTMDEPNINFPDWLDPSTKRRIIKKRPLTPEQIEDILNSGGEKIRRAFHKAPYMTRVNTSAPYPGNIGFEEMVRFYQEADHTQISKMLKAIENDDWNGFKRLIKEVLNVSLAGVMTMANTNKVIDALKKLKSKDQDLYNQFMEGWRDYLPHTGKADIMLGSDKFIPYLKSNPDVGEDIMSEIKSWLSGKVTEAQSKGKKILKKKKKKARGPALDYPPMMATQSKARLKRWEAVWEKYGDKIQKVKDIGRQWAMAVMIFKNSCKKHGVAQVISELEEAGKYDLAFEILTSAEFGGDYEEAYI